MYNNQNDKDKDYKDEIVVEGILLCFLCFTTLQSRA